MNCLAFIRASTLAIMTNVPRSCLCHVSHYDGDKTLAAEVVLNVHPVITTRRVFPDELYIDKMVVG